MIGFFSDYSNLIGRCRASDTGCDVGDEFNAGEVDIAGFELLISHSFDVAQFQVPVSVSYTHTDTAFQTRFESGFSQWGTVQAGDELPYVPNDVARIELGLNSQQWGLMLGAAYTGDARESAGQGDIADGDKLPSNWIVDASAFYQATQKLRLGLTIDNLFDEQVIVSRRPLGARPGKPQAVNISASFEF